METLQARNFWSAAVPDSSTRMRRRCARAPQRWPRSARRSTRGRPGWACASARRQPQARPRRRGSRSRSPAWRSARSSAPIAPSRVRTLDRHACAQLHACYTLGHDAHMHAGPAPYPTLVACTQPCVLQKWRDQSACLAIEGVLAAVTCTRVCKGIPRSSSARRSPARACGDAQNGRQPRACRSLRRCDVRLQGSTRAATR